jgi:hypothetical protein
LEALQRWLRWVLTDPRGVAGALADPRPKNRTPLRRYWAPSPACDAWLNALNPEDRTARLDVYAEGYFQRIADALEEDYPVLARMLGRTGFLKLAADYLKAHPTRSFTLGEAGRHVPEFLRGCPLAAETPWLTDLARFEWARVLAFHADDAPTLTADDLHAVPEVAWPSARFSIDPSLHLLDLAWPVDALAQAVEDADFATCAKGLRPSPTHLAVHRCHGSAVTQSIHPIATKLLREFQDGQSLEAVCARAEHWMDGSAGIAPARQLMAWFGEWVAAGWISRVIWTPEVRSAESQPTAIERNLV